MTYPFLKLKLERNVGGQDKRVLRDADKGRYCRIAETEKFGVSESMEKKGAENNYKFLLVAFRSRRVSSVRWNSTAFTRFMLEILFFESPYSTSVFF